MLVALQTVGLAVVVLNFTVLVPFVSPKFVPVMVMTALTAPELGERPAIVGDTMNIMPLLSTPATFTTTLPVVAPVGTGALIEFADQLVGIAVIPLNFTVLVP
jgi:hypothetical protein